MLNRVQLKNYRQLRGLSTRDVAFYCEISQPLITQIENGDRDLTPYNYKEIISGINKAYHAKKTGVFIKAPSVNLPKTAENAKAKTSEIKPKKPRQPRKKKGITND